MLREAGDHVLIDIMVQPRASRARLGPVHGDRLKVAVTAPPVDGKANRAVVELVARALNIPRRRVAVVTGHSSRRKTVSVAGTSLAAVRAAIGEFL